MRQEEIHMIYDCWAKCTKCRKGLVENLIVKCLKKNDFFT